MYGVQEKEVSGCFHLGPQDLGEVRIWSDYGPILRTSSQHLRYNDTVLAPISSSTHNDANEIIMSEMTCKLSDT